MTDTAGSRTEVLVVGAGPTGLATAIELQRRGIDCRLIEKEDSSVETSRALAIQPRTLQAFADMGVLDDVLDEGMRVRGATVYEGDRQLFALNLDYLDTSLQYPFLWWLPQNRTERILVDRLAELGGTVEFETELTGFRQGDRTVTATVRHSEGGESSTETITADWLVGCDGAHSRVRKTLGIELEGVTTPQEVLVADVTIDWSLPSDEASIWFHEDGVVAALPMTGDGLWRLFVDITPQDPEDRPEADIDVLQRLLRERTSHGDVSIFDAPWTSNFVTNQRMVPRYRGGRVLLAGDAAHVHNPLGGQGMNLGIQDAYNLGWKLALVVDGTGTESLVDTYEEERRPVAEAVLDETGVSGSLLVTANPVVKFARDHVLPRVLSSRQLQTGIFRSMSQLDVEYRDGSLSRLNAESPLAGLTDAPSWASAVRAARRSWNAPRAGDRVPNGPCLYPDGTETSLYDELHERTGFALLLFTGMTDDDAIDDLYKIARTVGGTLVTPYLIVPNGDSVPAGDDVAVLVDETGELHDRYDAAVPSLYLIRPDDYIGFRSRPARLDPLEAYLTKRILPDEFSDDQDDQTEATVTNRAGR